MMDRKQTSNNFEHKKLLLIVPHQDDEINVMGSLSEELLQKGYEVFVVYTTNGDYEFKAETRIKEGLNALKSLGISSNHVFILGYGDMLNNKCHPHIFSAIEPTVSPSGHSETYGISTKLDYVFMLHNKHHAYTRNNYLKDLKEIILQIEPDLLFVVDYDEHSDHRMTSLSFDRVMGEILHRKNNAYFPVVYKGFAYSTAYKAIDDFYNVNLLETRENKKISDLINCSIYQWSERVRFPVAKSQTGRFLCNKNLFKALCCHKSQNVGLNAKRIINSDKVFWERRTDSLGYKAVVIASSNQIDAHYVNDFMLYNTNDIDSHEPRLENYYWKPDVTDPDKSITFIWHKKQNIQLIRLFSQINTGGCIKKAKVTFDDGYEVEVGPFNESGAPVVISLEKIHSVSYCNIKILEAFGNKDYGWAECEFFESPTPGELQPFIKILINENFVYNYWVARDVLVIPLFVYSFHIDDKVIYSIVEDCYSEIVDNQLLIDKRDQRITIRATAVGYPSISDTITIYRKSSYQLLVLKVAQRIENFILTAWLRCHRKFYHLRKKYVNDI